MTKIIKLNVAEKLLNPTLDLTLATTGFTNFSIFLNKLHLHI